jgi:hypothetical protein
MVAVADRPGVEVGEHRPGHAVRREDVEAAADHERRG